MNWADTFREARGGLSQPEAAAALSGPTKADEFPVATLRDWEQGRREPPRWMQWMIVGVLMRRSLRPLRSARSTARR